MDALVSLFRRHTEAGTPPAAQAGLRKALLQILATGACYYLATRAAWILCFPDSKVSLFFPPQAILVAILLLVPTRHWWAYLLAAAGSHFFATQQEDWPPLYALQCEAFDALKAVLAAAGIRWFIKSRFDLITLREAVVFVLIAVVIVPAVTSFWGAAFTVSNGFGTDYWVEWRNLGISNGVTAIVLVPAILVGVHQFANKGYRAAVPRILEAGLLALGIIVVGYVAFDRPHAGPDTSPALLYAPIPFLLWAALRFGLGGISSAMLVITVLAISGTMRGHGPFLAQSPTENALDLQLFLLMAATPLMLLAVAIHDERRSKEALRVSEERMSLALESAKLSLWDWDVVNDRMWMTGEGREFFGITPDEAIRFSDLGGRVHPDDQALRTRAIRHALETSGAYELEYRILRPDGSLRWIATRGRLLNPGTEDAPARILGVWMDITRQKLADAEAQQQRDALAHLSRVATVGALSGSLAHELTQPLTSILSNAQAGRRFMAHATPDLAELRAIFEDVDGAASRAGGIIDRLRTMLRRSEVALGPVNVNESLDELLRLTRSDLIARRVVVSNLATGALPPAMTDRVQLQQVLLNLIMNACDAMDTNQPDDRTLTLVAFLTQNEMRIGVLDCGIGLPEDIEALFQPFHTTKEVGLGMGLSICRTLVTAHGGRLWAERRAGRGAAFYVSLSLARAEA
jgi:signal transduction histidine kinase/integral membrane sensor domain MASE1